MDTVKNKKTVADWIIDVALFGLFFYCFYIALTGLPEPLNVRSKYISLVLFLGFTRYRASKKNKSKKIPWYDWVCAFAGLASAVYIHLRYSALVMRMVYFDPLTTAEWIIGVTTLLLALELARRTMGLVLPILMLLAVGHCVFGPYFPGLLNHPGIPLRNVVDHLFLTSNGLYGSLTSLSLAEVFMFITFGGLIQIAGGEKFFSQIAESATRNMVGGPAKSAVIGSALFGCISGSGTANVYATGTVTIPMMMRMGFKPEFAAAVEACSSSLGQIIPPVMGSSAFLIAEFSGKPYLAVAAAAVLPSIFYVYAIYLAVHMECKKLGIGVFTGSGEIPPVKKVFLDFGHILIPVAVLIWSLVSRHTAYYSATMATLAVLAVCWLRSTTRLSFSQLIAGIRSVVWRVISIAASLFCAGMIVAVLQTTGIPYKFSSLIIDVAQGNLLLTLIMVALTVILLGMGLPVAGAFLIAALFGAPAMNSLGVDSFVAYMFIFMFSLTSVITPPVCLTTFAAASVAGSDFMRTGIRGMILGAPAYIIPFMVIYNPTLLNIFEKGVLFGVQSFLSTMLGITAFVIGVSGMFLRRLSMLQRGILVLVGFGLIWPGTVSDVLGFIGLVAIYLWQRYGAKQAAA